MPQNPHHYALQRARAIHELQLQQPLKLQESGRILGLLFPAEFLDEAEWQHLATYSPRLLLSGNRAMSISLSQQPSATTIDASGLSFAELQQWIGGVIPHEKLRPEAASLPHSDEIITLAKQAFILPAFIWVSGANLAPDAVNLEIEALKYRPSVSLIQGQDVALPLNGSENARLTSFREAYHPDVHLALQMGNTGVAIPLVRLHSSCVTGDILGSLRCDCGNQLQQALQQLKQADAGILLYLQQEGRAIGISNKLRAYALQEQGIDTFAANRQLGFADDERDFEIAAALLKALGYQRIRLLTNNPQKIEAFTQAQIEVVERVPLITSHTEHNQAYLNAKATLGGHLFAG